MLLKKNKFTFNLHLILSFIVALPLFVVIFSAPFVSYRAEISSFINQNLATLRPDERSNLSVEQILLNLRQSTNFQRLNRLEFSQDNTKAWRVSLAIDGQNISYFIDPRTGEVLGEDWGEKFSRLVLSLHRNLGLSMLGVGEQNAREIGKQIVAASSVAMSVLAISGIWLYFPLIRKNLWQSLKFSKKTRGYAFFYKLHASLGLWSGVFLLVMALSGLYWSYGWVRDGVNMAFGATTQTNMMRMKREKPAPTPTQQFAKIDAAARLFVEQNANKFKQANIMPPNKGEIYPVNFTSNDNTFMRAQVDLNASEVALQDDKNAQTSQRRAHIFIYRIHTGEFLGWVGQAVFALVCAVGVVVLVSGFLMMFKRVKRKA